MNHGMSSQFWNAIDCFHFRPGRNCSDFCTQFTFQISDRYTMNYEQEDRKQYADTNACEHHPEEHLPWDLFAFDRLTRVNEAGLTLTSVTELLSVSSRFTDFSLRYCCLMPGCSSGGKFCFYWYMVISCIWMFHSYQVNFVQFTNHYLHKGKCTQQWKSSMWELSLLSIEFEMNSIVWIFQQRKRSNKIYSSTTTHLEIISTFLGMILKQLLNNWKLCHNFSVRDWESEKRK